MTVNNTENVDETTTKADITYVVVSGEYDASKLLSVWSSKAEAEAECVRVRNDGGYNDVRVEEYFLNVSALDGARRRVRVYMGVLSLGSVSGAVTTADVRVLPTTFSGEMENHVFHYEGNENCEGNITSYSESRDDAVKLVLDEYAAFILKQDKRIPDACTE